VQGFEASAVAKEKKNQAGALAFCIVLLVLSGLNLKWVFYTVAIFNVDAWHDGKAFFSL